MSKNFRKRVFEGIVWSGLSRFTRLCFQFVVMVFLARVLIPEDFGLISLALIFTLLGTLTVGLGFGFSVVQKKDLSEEEIVSCFWICFLSGVAVCLITFFLSPFIALFFKKQLLAPILQVLCVINIIWGIGLVPTGILRRNLQFKQVAVSEVGAMFAYGIVSVLLAVNHCGVWSLVWGNVASYCVSTFLICKACSWMPSLKFSRRAINDLWGYSIRSMGTSILHYSGTNIDYMIVGKLLGPIALGYYSMAYNLVTLPQRQLATIITGVSFPAFSKIQDDNERLKRGYLKNITYIGLFSFPLLGGLAVVAPEFVKVVFGDKWEAAILPLQILSIAGMLYAVGTPINPLLLAKGRADIDLKMTFLRLAMISLFVFLGSRYGIVGVASAISIFAFVFIPVFQNIVNSLIKMTMKEYYDSVAAALWSSLIMCSCLLLYRYAGIRFLGFNEVILLVSSVIFGGILYLFFLKIFKFDQWKELPALMR